MVTPKKTLGANIRRLRLLRRLSQEELSEQAGIHYTFLGHIERGTKAPSLTTLCSIAQALTVTPSQLMRGICQS
ncbi:MAG TPA: XRE family transcriptional regulator [Elusimicrobia bacterium]|nr:XRE family transcriptional regulator [Elusimicrobiota bacterium]HBT61018.1 XRE family transcriptional regulator [Elusimicrobiota bacterium]